MISLITDFGLKDSYAGIMKGVILTVDPAAVIVDLTHGIPPQDIAAAAYTIRSAFHFFPEGTIHVLVVDPGVGGDRRVLAASAAGHVFLAPDNGALTLILKSCPIDGVFGVENSRYFRHPVSRTFHGRDIFAPVAGHLSVGLAVDQLGPRIAAGQWVTIDLPEPRLIPGREIVGEVIRVDHFGNLITNIEYAMVAAAFGTTDPRLLKITGGDCHIAGISGAYRDAASGALLALVGSTGMIEISVNGGNAAKIFKIGPGDPVVITAGKSNAL